MNKKELAHWGIKGMRWGHRKKQDERETSENYKRNKESIEKEINDAEAEYNRVYYKIASNKKTIEQIEKNIRDSEDPKSPWSEREKDTLYDGELDAILDKDPEYQKARERLDNARRAKYPDYGGRYAAKPEKYSKRTKAIALGVGAMTVVSLIAGREKTVAAKVTSIISGLGAIALATRMSEKGKKTVDTMLYSEE